MLGTPSLHSPLEGGPASLAEDQLLGSVTNTGQRLLDLLLWRLNWVVVQRLKISRGHFGGET